jgi:hypothetical protein
LGLLLACEVGQVALLCPQPLNILLLLAEAAVDLEAPLFLFADGNGMAAVAVLVVIELQPGFP